MQILIVKLSAIGDVIHTLPALNALRACYPRAAIHWLVEAAAAPLIQGHPALDQVWVCRRKQWIQAIRSGDPADRQQALAEFRDLLTALRSIRFDWVIDFQHLLKSGFWVALCRGEEKIGFDRGLAHMEGSYLFLNRRIPPVSMEMHALKRNLLLVEALGVPCERISYQIPLNPGDRAAADRLLGESGMDAKAVCIGIHPITPWPTKQWRPEKFADLADRLVEGYGAGVVFTGAPADRGAIQAIQAGMGHPSANLAGKTSLKGLAALYRRLQTVVTVDSGPMHLAAAMGKPVVALFGPTAPWRTGPYGPGHQIIRANMACGPCFKRHCQSRACMAALSVETVLAGVRRVLKSA